MTADDRVWPVVGFSALVESWHNMFHIENAVTVVVDQIKDNLCALHILSEINLVR